MNLPPLGSWLALWLVVCPLATAIEIRDYDESDINGSQKWLLHIPGQWLWGHPPYVNPAFTLCSPAKLLGIGWPETNQEWTRQIALISPRHAVYATHYLLDPGWQINYLGSDGQQHALTIESQTPVINSQGQQTDLMLVTFTTPMTAAGVKPFKVLNLANETDYQNKPLLVCGSFVTAATTKLDGFTTLSNDPGFDTTRFIYFNYKNNGTTTSDPVHTCKITPGDSGGPVMVMENGEPLIVGVISSYDELAHFVTRSYACSLPSYLPELDTLMEAKGYHITRSQPASTAVSVQAAASAVLKPAQSGSITFTTANTGSAAAHNIALQLTFSSAPTGVSGTGWICEAVSSTVWNCHRGGLATGANASLTANWNILPNAPHLKITTEKSYDGATSSTQEAILPIQQNYTSWVQGAADTAQNADPDHDGISNAVEFALGGSPVQASRLSIYGNTQLPQVEKSGNQLLFKYPHRTDAAARGIVDEVEYSTSLTSGSWDTVSPAGTVIQSTPFIPAVPGFEQVTVSIPANVPKRFMRMRISVTE